MMLSVRSFSLCRRQKVHQHADGRIRILEGDRFGRVMADPASAAHEQHRDGTQRRHRHGVVTGAGGEMHGIKTRSTCARIERGDQTLIAGRGWRAVCRRNTHFETTLGGDLLDRSLNLIDNGVACGIHRRARIDGEAGLAGNDVDGTGKRLDHADRGDDIRRRARDALSRTSRRRRRDCRGVSPSGRAACRPSPRRPPSGAARH